MRQHKPVGRQRGCGDGTIAPRKSIADLPVGKSLHVAASPEKAAYVAVSAAGICKLKIYTIYLSAAKHNVSVSEIAVTENAFRFYPVEEFRLFFYKCAQLFDRIRPLRYNETSTLFRNEASGEMHGLIRLRQFTISEGHLACTPEQLEGEFAGCLELAKYMLTTLGLEEDVFYRFSKWDKNDRQKYIGSEEAWEAAQDTMRRILNDLHIDYYEADGEAAFYGPKLDIQIKNVHGKEDTLITIQIDFQLAEKFGMEYVDRDNKRKYPYVIHRTSIGCYERTLALLIEKYAGAFPLWLAPEQARVILISDDRKPYAEEVLRTLKDAGLRASLDDRNEKLGFKIREAQLEKLPYMLIVGGKEAENGTVGVRSRKEGDLGAMTPGAFIEKAAEEIRTKAR